MRREPLFYLLKRNYYVIISIQKGENKYEIFNQKL